MQMVCMEIVGSGADAGLRVAERPIPVPRAGEVLIRVKAAGVNRPDLIQRQGMYPPPPGASDILGLEVAGSVEDVGEGVTDLRRGQTVCALVTGGGYAQYCIAAAPLCLPLPRGFDAIRAAAIPETFFTVWHNLFQRAEMRAGETLLVHGGGSGIGTTAIQLAKAFQIKVFTTAGSDRKCLLCTELGADRAINYRTEDFVAVIEAETARHGVDVVLDMVGGDYLPRNIKCLAVDGRHVSIAFLAGPKAEVNFLPVMLKRLVLTGSTLRPQSVADKQRIADDLLSAVWPLFDSGQIAPVIGATLPLERAEEAHRLLDSGTNFGKIVLTL